MIYRKSEIVHTVPNVVTDFQELAAIRNMNIGIAEIPIAANLNIS